MNELKLSKIKHQEKIKKLKQLRAEELKERVKKFILWRKLHPNYSSRCHYCKIFIFPKTSDDLQYMQKCKPYWCMPYGCTEFLKKENYKTKE